MKNGDLIGAYYHSLDDKNRIIIPAAYEALKGEVLYSILNSDETISLYPDLSSIEESLFPVLDDVKVDADKRINLGKQISSLLSKYKKIEKIAILGKKDHIDLVIDKNLDSYLEKNNFERLSVENKKLVLVRKK